MESHAFGWISGNGCDHRIAIPIGIAIAFCIAIKRPCAHPTDSRFSILDTRSAHTPISDFGFPLTDTLTIRHGDSLICRIEHRASSIEHRASSIEHRASSIEHRASSIEHRSSSIEHRASLLLLESERMDFPSGDEVLLFETGERKIGKRLFAIDNCEARSGAKDFPYDDGIVVVV